MFTRPDQLQRKGGPEERFSFLKQLKEEFLITTSFEAKQQVLANLANFAYDPINYNFIKQLQIVDLFLKEIQLQQNEELSAYAIGGLCNLSNDPEIASYITTETTITILLTLLYHRNKDIVLNSLTTLYYLARNEISGHLIKSPEVLNKLLAFRDSPHSANDPRLTNLTTIFLREIWDVPVNDNSSRLESAEGERGMGTLLIKRLFCSGLRITRPKCKVGDKVVSTRRITKDDVLHFARLSGDTNPIHLPRDEKEMAVVHGAFLNGIVSGVIGTQLPGPGTLVAWQSLHFPDKCYPGESVITQVEVVNVRKIIHLKFDCTVDSCAKSSKQKCVLHGEAKVVQR